MSATFYVNAPLNREEHAALERMANAEGRAKGQQLRLIARRALGLESAAPSVRITSVRPTSKKKEVRRG